MVIPTKLLKDGENTFTLKRDEPGEVFYSIEARVYQPVTDETQQGMRVLRRYEVSDAGRPVVGDDGQHQAIGAGPLHGCRMAERPPGRAGA